MLLGSWEHSVRFVSEPQLTATSLELNVWRSNSRYVCSSKFPMPFLLYALIIHSFGPYLSAWLYVSGLIG
jgi:hypothetical protein